MPLIPTPSGAAIAEGAHPSPLRCPAAQTLLQTALSAAYPIGGAGPSGTQVLPPMNLNLSPDYGRAIAGFGTTRELVQNWHDRCLALCPGAAVKETAATTAKARLFACGARGKAAGYVLEWRSSDGVPALQLTNFGTTLSPDILVLGHSDKGNATGAAGCFGEGMKVEINRLVARQVKVQIFTGDACWVFDHRPMEGSSRGLEVLTMTSAAIPFCPHTSVLLSGAALAPLDTNTFLFLQPPIPADSGTRFAGDALEILLGSRHDGNVYVHGIHVWTCPSLKGFGLNFVGPASMYASLGFGRDRNTLQIRPLITLLPQTVAQCKARHPQYRMLVEWLYDTMLTAPDCELRHLVSPLNPTHGPQADALLDLANECVATMTALHGPTSYPVPQREGGLGLEGPPGLKPVPVSDPLLALLHRSPHCRTLDKLLRASQQDVFRYPDAPPALAARGAAFRALVDTWFRPSMTGDRLLFKTFPLGNTKPVVLASEDKGEPFYAVDLTLLESDKVHRWQKAESRSCLDQQPSGACGGACVVQRFREALLTAVEGGAGGAQVRRRLEDREQAAYLKRLARDQSLAQPPPANGGSPSGTKPPPAPHRRNSPSPPARPPSPRPPAPSPAIAHATSRVRRRPSDQGPRTVATVAATAGRAEQEIAQACLGVKGTGPVSTLQAPAFHRHPEPDAEEEGPIALMLLQTVWVGEGDAACEVPLYVTTATTTVPSTRVKAMRRLAALVTDIAWHVFWWPPQQTMDTVGVFWEEGPRAAFNYRGTLYFNAMYFEAWAHGAPHQAHAAKQFWFVTFCHELAHNWAPAHDKAHGQATETLVALYMGALSSF